MTTNTTRGDLDYHRCAPTESEAMWGETLPHIGRVEVSMHCMHKDGA